jgi:hypothetical protein
MIACGVVARHRERERDAVHHRHANVGQQKVEPAAVADHQIERLGAVGRHEHLMAVLGERPGNEAAQRLFVFGNEDARHLFAVNSRRPRRRAD